MPTAGLRSRTAPSMVWAGLDPIMAGAEQAGATLLYRNVGFNSYGFLNATESFLTMKPTWRRPSSTPMSMPARGRRRIRPKRRNSSPPRPAWRSWRWPRRSSPSGPISTSTRCRARPSARSSRSTRSSFGGLGRRKSQKDVYQALASLISPGFRVQGLEPSPKLSKDLEPH